MENKPKLVLTKVIGNIEESAEMYIEDVQNLTLDVTDEQSEKIVKNVLYSLFIKVMAK